MDLWLHTFVDWEPRNWIKIGTLESHKYIVSKYIALYYKVDFKSQKKPYISEYIEYAIGTYIQSLVSFSK